jgi:putative transposase
VSISHKIRLEPNNKQITYFKKACGVARFCWNWGVAKWEEDYKQGLKPSGMTLKKEFNSIKKELFPFTYEVTKYASQQPFIQLQEAFNRYFKSLKSKTKIKVGRPKFKKKGKSKDSFYIGGDQIVVKNQKVKIPNLGYVKLSEDIRFQGKFVNATITREANNWFISFTIEPLVSFLPCKNQTSIGVDLGSKAFVTISNGVQIFANKPLKANLRRLKRLSRQLDKKQHSKYKGDKTTKSKNYERQSQKVSKLHIRIANIRKDNIHKITTFLTDNFQNIAIEDLNTKGMMSNSKLSRAISDLGFYEFKRQLLYKAEQKQNRIVIADRFYPSSKTCSNCGSIKSDLKLKDRVYKCPDCGIEIDRDLNASINLKNLISDIPIVCREFTDSEMTAMLNRQGLVSSIVEQSSEHQISKFG